jgi:hypothetical protein
VRSPDNDGKNISDRVRALFRFSAIDLPHEQTGDLGSSLAQEMNSISHGVELSVPLFPPYFLATNFDH